MHVGWAATFKPPDGKSAPRFAELRDHIATRLSRAPRYRQRIARVPLGLNAPIWVDDESFDVNRHVIASSSRHLQDLVDSCMSEQLPRDRPLWQICISDRLEDGRIGLVGKAHHCMVDGIAAVELASLLLDPTPDPPASDPDHWRPEPAPGPGRRLVGGIWDLVRSQASLARLPALLTRSPGKRVGEAYRAAEAFAQALRPAQPREPVNQPITAARHLAWFDRPFADLKRIGKAFGVSVNDVLLAVSAGGMRAFVADSGQDVAPLKTMVPVNLRGDDEAFKLGNRVSFVFVDLPCDEADPVRRLQDVHLAMSERKEAGDPEAADAALAAIKYLPRAAQHAISRAAASPRSFNITVSNIPGPPQAMYMLGCEMEVAYPVVPIADDHAVSIGMTTVADKACFGFYAARESLPDADRMAAEVDASIDELLDRV
jgi:WS/DGAT/MGAT family acyltransferase